MLVFVLVLPACTKPNPDYCTRNADCPNGTTCNNELHGCEAIADAASGDGPVDAMLVARTVQQVRDPFTPADTPVELKNVVVVAVDQYGVRAGDFWVQQSGGGMGSGIRIYGGLPSQVALLHPGDVVDIANGRKYFYTTVGDTSGRKEIEVLAVQNGILEITKKGLTIAPVVATLDAAAIAALSPTEIDIEREKWAGVYVQVSLVRAATEPTLVNTDQSLLQFPISAFFVQSAQAEFPAGIVANTCLSSVRGVVEYVKAYNIIPVRTTDVVIGTGCP